MVTKLLRSALMATLPIALVCGPMPAAAQMLDDPLHAGTLEVPMNKSQVVRTERAIARAMVGNPEIADIVPLTERSVYVLGKGMGTTSLTLYDSAGRVLAVMNVAVGPDADAFRKQAERLIPNAKIDAQISGDSLVLTGMAYDTGDISRAMQLARTYAGDKVVNMIGLGASQQVMLEVRFAEVSRSVGQDLGFRGFIQRGSFNAVTGPGSTLTPDPDTGAAVLAAGSISNGFGIFGETFRFLGMNFETYLNALETKGLAKTLAEPTLVALSGETAAFLAGGEFPVPVIQQGAAAGAGAGQQGVVGAITVQFKPFGVSLGFTPTVLGDRTINLRVEPEVSAIDPAASFQLNGISIPGIQTRRVSTTLELRDGESFAIAGLLQRDFRTIINQVPILGSIPILGTLFRSTEFQKGETELLVIVTPRLVQPIRPDQVRLPTDRIKDPDAAASILLGEDYIEVPLPPAKTAAPQGDDYEF